MSPRVGRERLAGEGPGSAPTLVELLRAVVVSGEGPLNRIPQRDQDPCIREGLGDTSVGRDARKVVGRRVEARSSSLVKVLIEARETLLEWRSKKSSSWIGRLVSGHLGARIAGCLARDLCGVEVPAFCIPMMSRGLVLDRGREWARGGDVPWRLPSAGGSVGFVDGVERAGRSSSPSPGSSVTRPSGSMRQPAGGSRRR